MGLRVGVVGALLVAGSIVVTGCGSDSDAVAGSSTTPPTTIDGAPTTAAPREAIPGLWLATATGVVDEDGVRWASPEEGRIQTFRSLVDDGAGGVYYLRCDHGPVPGGLPSAPGDPVPTDPEPTAPDTTGAERDADLEPCAVEHATDPSGDPVGLGSASELLGAGSWQGVAVLAAVGWSPAGNGADPSDATPPSTVATTAPVDGGVPNGTLVDAATGEAVTTFDWWGDQEPVVFDVTDGLLVGCVGHGEACAIVSAPDPTIAPTPVEGIDADLTVSSLVVDGDGSILAWIEVEPMGGSVTAVHLDLAGGGEVREELRGSDEAQALDAVTDGVWAAVRVGETVHLTELLDGTGAGSRTVPESTTEIALRSMGGAGSLSSRL